MCIERNKASDAMIGAKERFMVAVACHEQGNFGQAEVLYREALELVPGRPSVMLNLAIVLYRQQKYEEACALCERVVEIDPHNAAAHGHLGNCLAQGNQIDAAMRAYESALRLQPESAETLNNRGNLFFKIGRFAEALDDYTRAVTINPQAAGQYNRGRTLRELQRPVEALAAYEQALEAGPNYPDLFYDLGNVMHDLGRIDDAAKYYLQAAQLNPALPERWNALGVVRQEQGRMDEALILYEKALSLNADFRDARYNRARALLFLQDFGRAWPDYDCRIGATGFGATLRNDPKSMGLFENLPRWRGPGHLAERVAIWGEQGIGDQLLFSSLLPDLIAVGASFIYEVDGRLIEMYRRAFPEVRFVALHEPPAPELRSAEAVLLAGSLPGIFRPTPESFSRQPLHLLKALPERVVDFRERLAKKGSGLRVALSWRSTRKDRQGRDKSVRLAQMAPLFEVPGVQFVDVQYGDTSGEHKELARVCPGASFTRFEDVDYFHDLENVFALIDACDLLITTSNANAHFAGVLGKPAWVLYAGGQPPFHYWAHDKDRRCLWYPSTVIMSKSGPADWAQLIAGVAEKLGLMAQTGSDDAH